MTPCYKKFTLILARGDIKESGETRSSKRNSSGNNTAAWIYPNICNICKKGSVKFEGKKAFPITITAIEATESIKEAAKTKDPQLHAEIKDIDLIEKELKYHEHCRRNFTRKIKCEENKEPVSVKFIVLINLFFQHHM